MDLQATFIQKTVWEIQLEAGRNAIVDGKFSEAKKLLNNAFEIVSAKNSEDPRLIQIHEAFAELYTNNKKHELAEEHYQSALALIDEYLGKNYIGLPPILDSYASLLQLMKREKEAEELILRAVEIRENSAGRLPVRE